MAPAKSDHAEKQSLETTPHLSPVGSSGTHPFHKPQTTYLKIIAGLGFVDAFLIIGGIMIPHLLGAVQLFCNFTLRVAILGWCYSDAEAKLIPITGPLRFVMLLIPCVGVPWYFVRRSGIAGAFIRAFGLWLYALCYATAIPTVVLIAGIIYLFIR